MLGQITGDLDLSIIARRIPTTVDGEIKTDTPSEFTELEFNIASSVDLEVDFGFCKLGIDGAVNSAGPEHLVVDADASFATIDVYGIVIDELTIVPELWFAVPFEAVTDVNGLPNSAIIPPADPMFVAGRVTTSWKVYGFSVRQVLLFQDIMFPNPGGQFGPLTYTAADQLFDIGSLTYVSWRAQIGISISSTTGINASQGSRAIKGYSASGKVIPGEFFETLSISGIQLRDFEVGGVVLQDPRIGVAVTMTDTQTPSGSVSFSARLSESFSISTSASVFSGPPLLGSISLSGSFGPYRFAFLLDQLAVSSLSASFNVPLNLGAMTGSFASSFTGLERGLTGMSLRLALSQGTLSGNMSASFSQLGDHFGFASLTTQMSLRFSPGIISLQVTFGRYGLTRAAVNVGLLL